MPWSLFASHQASVFCHGARSFWATVSCWHWAGFLASKFDLHSMGIHTLVFGFSSNPVFKEMLQKFKFLEFILSPFPSHHQPNFPFFPLFSFSHSCTYLENFTFLEFCPQDTKFPQVLLVCKLYYWQGDLSVRWKHS